MAAAQLSFEIAIPKELTDANLHEALKSSIRCEMRLVGYIVELIREIDSRRLYLEYGCTSLFSYLTEVAGYTAGPAQARIDAARLMNDVPTIADDLKDGSINLTQVSIVAQSIRQKAKESPQAKPSAQEKRELFEAIKTCDIAQSQKVVAEKLDIEVKTFERKTTQQDGSLRAEMTFSPEEQRQITRLKELLSHTLPGASIQEALMAAAVDYLKRKDPLTKPTKGNVLTDTDEALTAKSAVNTSGLGINGANFLENSTLVGGGLSSSSSKLNFESKAFGGLDKLASTVTSVSEAISSKVDRMSNSKSDSISGAYSDSAVPVHKSNTVAKSFDSRNGQPPARAHVSRVTARIIHQRDQCCQWRDQRTGKTCGSRFQLQIDHIQPVWAGGSNDESNLQILCAAHNRMRYRAQASISHMT